MPDETPDETAGLPEGHHYVERMFPEPVDLTQTNSLSVTRGVPPRERRRLLGSSFPQWA